MWGVYGVGWRDLDFIEWPDFTLMVAHIEGRRAAQRRAERDAERRARL